MSAPPAVSFRRNTLMLTAMLPLCLLFGCPRTVPLPSLVGADRAAVAETLAAADLAQGTVVSVYSDTAPLGRVLSQDPASGDRVTPDSAVSIVVSRGRVILADANSHAAAAAQDGLTWATAYDTLQEAVDTAYYRSAEVWAARGSFGENRAAKNADGSLVLKDGTALYGGFAAVENFREERNWSGNVTVIDGSGARGGSPAYHVVAGAEDARLDGFTVRGGGTDESARGGMVNGGASLTVANCAFADNVGVHGGAMSIWGLSSSVTLSGCTFTRNAAGFHGGAIFMDGGTLTVTDCTFDNNAADNDGGAVCSAGADVTFTNTSFSRNTATALGGAYYIFNGGEAILTNCQFYENDARTGSAMAAANALSSATMTNCTFHGNTADDTGGAVYGVHASLAAANSIFWGNSGGGGGGDCHRRNSQRDGKPLLHRGRVARGRHRHSDRRAAILRRAGP